MAAKIATRTKSQDTKIDPNEAKFRVVAAADGKPVYPGEGVGRAEADRLAANLQIEARVVAV